MKAMWKGKVECLEAENIQAWETFRAGWGGVTLWWIRDDTRTVVVLDCAGETVG